MQFHPIGFVLEEPGCIKKAFEVRSSSDLIEFVAQEIKALK